VFKLYDKSIRSYKLLNTDRLNRKKNQEDILLSLHKLHSEALRKREQDVLQLIVLLATTYGGFSWIVTAWAKKVIDIQNINLQEVYAFIIIIALIVLVLALGAYHTIVLGYNYRSTLLQLRKIEKSLGINSVILNKWSNFSAKNIQTSNYCISNSNKNLFDNLNLLYNPLLNYKHLSQAISILPEIVLPFYLAYVIGIFLMTIYLSFISFSSLESHCFAIYKHILIVFSLFILFIVVYFLPLFYLRKLCKVSQEENI